MNFFIILEFCLSSDSFKAPHYSDNRGHSTFNARQTQTVHLEFLSEYEVEARTALGTVYIVKAVGPVDTHESHHRQIDAQTGASRTFQRSEEHTSELQSQR